MPLALAPSKAMVALLSLPCLGWALWLSGGVRATQIPSPLTPPWDDSVTLGSPSAPPAGGPLAPATNTTPRPPVDPLALALPTPARRQAQREGPTFWAHRYRDLTLGTIAEAISQAEARLIDSKKSAAQACFAKPSSTVGMREFAERERLDRTMYLPRIHPKTGSTEFALIRESEYPRVFERRRELRWLLERRLALRKAHSQRPPTVPLSRRRPSPPPSRPPSNPPSVIRCGSDAWILCGPEQAPR